MKILHSIILLAIIASTTACTSFGGDKKLGLATPRDHAAVLHAVDSGELRIIMRRMNNLMYERNLTDQELDVQRRKAYAEVLETANGVEQSINTILAYKSRLNLNETEQHVFEKMALNLKTEAGKLKTQAETQQMEAIHDTLTAMTGTCNTCHELFRDFSKKGT